jgi:hypothetical protein
MRPWLQRIYCRWCGLGWWTWEGVAGCERRCQKRLHAEGGK